jgi:hypothetical protein
MGICKLCLNQKELQLSHAIPNTYFRHILRASGGNAIKMASDNFSHIVNTNDSGKELMLCRKCEGDIERNYESHANFLFKNERGIIYTKEFVSYGTYKPKKLILFFISIIWRAANSNQELYKDISLLPEHNDYFRRAILNFSNIPSNRVGVKCYQLSDLNKAGYFSQEDLKNLICALPPLPTEKYKLYKFCFFGIYAEICIWGFKHKFRGEYGVLSKTNKVLTMPYINIFEIPQIKQFLLINKLGHD